MQYIVESKEPDQGMRQRLWEIFCSWRLPLSPDFDFQKLTYEFTLNGGDIKNTLIRAATRRTLSVDANRAVTMQELVEACEEAENQK